MRAIIILLVLGLTATSVMSACAAANAWQDAVVATTSSGMVAADVTTSNAGAATTADGVSKCAFTLGTTLVCADQTKLYVAIQKYIDNTRTTLETAAGVRDKYIIDQRGEVVKVFSTLRRLNELYAANKAATIPTAYSTLATAFLGFATDITTNFTAVVEGLTTFQTNRATCLNALLATQAAILCKSFVDGGATGMVITDGSESASLDDTLLASLSTTCLPYITTSATQSKVILSGLYAGGFATLLSGFEKLIAGNSAGAATDLASAWTAFGKVTYSSTASQKPVELPTACTTATLCQPFIESDWWTTGAVANTGLLKQDAVIQAGTIPTRFTFSSRVLKSEGNERRLAANGMTATLASYGFTYGFKANPGSIDNTVNAKSALRNGVVACAVAALALFF